MPDFLWKFLRRNNLGQKFHRQFGIGRYIVDFCCWQKNLVIEVDGGIHLKPEIKEYDKQREIFLNSLGFTILRFKNHEVLENINIVIKKIETFLQKEPSPQGGG